MYCKKCGSILKDGAKFCAACGEKITLQNPNNTSSNQQKANINQYYSTSVKTKKNKKEKNKSNKTKVLISIIICLIIALICVAVFFVIGNNNHKENSALETEEGSALEITISSAETTKKAETTNDKKKSEKEEKKKEIINTIEQYESQNDYEGGIKYIDNDIGVYKNETEIITKYNDMKDKYRTKVLDEAESTFKAKGYQSAIDLLNKSLKLLPNDATISKKIDEYQSYAPVHIKKLVATKEEDCSFFETERDPRGNYYSDGLYLYSNNDGGISDDGLIELYTGKKYSSFSCEIVPESDFTTKSDCGARIKVYSDDTLIYTSDIITYKTIPVKVELNITNTDYLKIQIENITPGNYYAHADTLIVNPYVKK